MIIKIPITFKGSKGEKKLYSLFDTGSIYSCIREDLAEKIGLLNKLSERRYFGTAEEDQFMKVES